MENHTGSNRMTDETTDAYDFVLTAHTENQAGLIRLRLKLGRMWEREFLITETEAFTAIRQLKAGIKAARKEHKRLSKLEHKRT